MTAAAEPTAPTAPAVLTEREGSVLVVTINRPEAMNAINAAVSLGVGEALEEAEHDRDVRAVVLTGAGDRAFCAGADLKAASRGETLHAPGHEEWGFAGYTRHPISKPTIAAVNGFALGGGTEISLASDLVVALSSAQFGLPEVKRGIFAGAGGVIRLPRQIPRKVAMEMILTGDPLTADDAHRWGLVNSVVETDVVGAALALAQRIAENAPLSVQASKRIALHALDGDEDGAWERNRAEGQRLMQSDDAKEGPRAFAEKRVPVWTGR
jgi:crotonobetainyl-CoA hydratase